MNTDSENLNVLSILGNDYTIKVPEGQQQALVTATALLKASLADTKRRHPTLVGDKLLVLAALNLCSQQVELKRQHQEELDRLQSKVSATVDVIEKSVRQG